MNLKSFFDKSGDYIDKYVGSPSNRMEGLSNYEADVRPVLPSSLKTIFDTKYLNNSAQITVSKIGVSDYLGIALVGVAVFLVMRLT